MSDIYEVWNIERPKEITNIPAVSSFPRNQLGPSYAPFSLEEKQSNLPRNQLGPSFAPYTQEEVSGVNYENTTYQPKNVYTNTLGMSPVITHDFITRLFSDDYFLKLLGEFMIANNIKEGFTMSNITNYSNMFDIIFKVFVVFMIILILFKLK